MLAVIAITIPENGHVGRLLLNLTLSAVAHERAASLHYEIGKKCARRTETCSDRGEFRGQLAEQITIINKARIQLPWREATGLLSPARGETRHGERG